MFSIELSGRFPSIPSATWVWGERDTIGWFFRERGLGEDYLLGNEYNLFGYIIPNGDFAPLTEEEKKLLPESTIRAVEDILQQGEALPKYFPLGTLDTFRLFDVDTTDIFGTLFVPWSDTSVTYRGDDEEVQEFLSAHTPLKEKYTNEDLPVVFSFSNGTLQSHAAEGCQRDTFPYGIIASIDIVEGESVIFVDENTLAVGREMMPGRFAPLWIFSAAPGWFNEVWWRHESKDYYDPNLFQY